MRQMLHDGRPPLVETGLAKHAFPPYGCGSLHTPQYVVRREGNHLLCQKTSPCKGGHGGHPFAPKGPPRQITTKRLGGLIRPFGDPWRRGVWPITLWTPRPQPQRV